MNDGEVFARPKLCFETHAPVIDNFETERPLMRRRISPGTYADALCLPHHRFHIADVNPSYFLPAIQRPYVWSSAQIIALFDSLLKGYPIRRFMFWAVDEETKTEIRCYRFFENYRPDARNEPTSADGRQVVLVLDGQQQLTSLMIGLRGTFSEKAKGARISNTSAWSSKVLYLDLLKDPDPHSSDEDVDNEFGITYGLAFHERKPANNSQLAAGIGAAVEDFLIMAFVAQAAVEAFDVAVLLRLARVYVGPSNAVVVGPP